MYGHSFDRGFFSERTSPLFHLRILKDTLITIQIHSIYSNFKMITTQLIHKSQPTTDALQTEICCECGGALALLGCCVAALLGCCIAALLRCCVAALPRGAWAGWVDFEDAACG